MKNIDNEKDNSELSYEELVRRMIFPKDDKHSGLYLTHKYDSELNLYKKILSQYEAPIFFDIGCNVGFYSVMLSDLCKEIHAFEPIANIHKCAEFNTQIFNNISLNRLAISDKICDSQITISQSHTQGSTLDNRMIKKFGHVYKNRYEEITCTTLENYMTMKNISIIHLAKIDIEGFEYRALIGAGKFLNNFENIILECFFEEDLIRINNLCDKIGFKIKPLNLNTGGPMFHLSK